ncbi:MAG TPA: ABC transporter ATP-binding protein [Xanthobacteraceae bacterium]|jgi:iron(III) transport system ATP-binding protein|nr:ABC transporter ATP-binding protein [Xanthobacteraceae bacterium]
MAKLEIEDVVVCFGDVVAVDRVSLQVEEGETVVLLGPSGCGKTTLLRLVAGFNRPKSGTVRIAGRIVASPTVVVPPEKRSLSMVFQSYAVWPHKTVFENLAYGLRLRRMNAAMISAKVTDALATVRMEAYASRYPSELSGGQQQRVALARALVLEPEILLFDEPLSNLDATLREHMRFEIKALLSKLKITSIYVTHDQNEAMVVADRVAVMNRGRIEQIGTPEDVYYRSKTDFVAQFIGLANVLDARIMGAADSDHLNVRVEHVGDLVVRANLRGNDTSTARIFVRPEHIELTSAPKHGAPKQGMNTLKGRVARRSFVGAQTDYVIDVNGVPLRVISRNRDVDCQLSQDVLLSFAAADCLLLAG